MSLGFDNTIILALEGSKLVDNIIAGPPHTVMVADKIPRISKHQDIYSHTALPLISIISTIQITPTLLRSGQGLPNYHL